MPCSLLPCSLLPCRRWSLESLDRFVSPRFPSSRSRYPCKSPAFRRKFPSQSLLRPPNCFPSLHFPPHFPLSHTATNSFAAVPPPTSSFPFPFFFFVSLLRLSPSIPVFLPPISFFAPPPPSSSLPPPPSPSSRSPYTTHRFATPLSVADRTAHTPCSAPASSHRYPSPNYRYTPSNAVLRRSRPSHSNNNARHSTFPSDCRSKPGHTRSLRPALATHRAATASFPGL